MEMYQGSKKIFSDSQINARVMFFVIYQFVFSLFFSVFGAVILITLVDNFYIHNLFLGIFTLLGGIFFLSRTGKTREKIRTSLLRARNLLLEEIAAEELRMKKIQESMSPAEWNTYLIQLENNRLLNQISQKNKGQAPGVRPMFGVTRDIPDSGD